MPPYLLTSDISRTVGVHPKTGCLYAAFLPPIPRSKAGYRQFWVEHLEQMRIARLAFAELFAGRRLRASARDMMRVAAEGALAHAHDRTQCAIATAMAWLLIHAPRFIIRLRAGMVTELREHTMA